MMTDPEDEKHSLKKRIGIAFAYAMKVLIGIFTVYSFLTGFYVMTIWGIFGLFLSLNPLILTRRVRVHLPWELNLLIVTAFYLHIFGSLSGWYDILDPFYDKFAHLISSITIAVLGFIAAVILDKYTEIKFNRIFIVFLVIVLTMALGALWEVSEFWYDQLFGGNMQKGLSDTMFDLMFDLIGGIIIAILGWLYLESVPLKRFLNEIAFEERKKNR